MPQIFGLDWKHPAVFLNVISGMFFTVYFVVAIAILHIPPGRYPYPISIVGASLMCLGAVWLVSESDKTSVRIGYVWTAINIFVSSAHILIIISHLAGPNSSLWRMMN